jgi:hypothetical protein
MRSVFAFVVVSLAASSLACSLLHKSEATDAGATDAGAAATDAATAGPPPTADNVNQVARFPDETSLGNASAKIEDPRVTVRNAVPSGAAVATLTMNTPVVEMASHDTFVLVSFSDPKNAGHTLMGWVGKEAFVPGPSPAPKAGCPAGMERMVVEDQPFCGKVCSADKDCPKGETCSGRANSYGPGGALGPEKDTCTVPAPGTPPSAPPAPGGATILGVQQPPGPGNSCPAKFVLASDKMCHLDCSKSPQCPPKSRCTATLTNPKQPVCEEQAK